MTLTPFRPPRLALVLALEVFVGGCRPPPTMPVFAMPPLPPLNMATGGAVAIGQSAPLRPTFHPPEIDLGWLDSEGLAPPGAKIIDGDERSPRSLVATPRASFPSSAECDSPDEQWRLLSEASRGSGQMIHTLHAFKRGQPTPTDLLKTEFSFDALWSQNSRLVAVTEYTGENASRIFLVNITTEQNSGYIDVEPALAPYFSAEERSWPRFQRAYRWSDAELVIRGIAHAPEPPYDLIGYEVLFHVDELGGVVRMALIRGYTKHPKS